MDFDFATFLVLAVAVTGAIWALDVVVWAPRRRQAAAASGGATAAIEGEEEKKERAKEPVVVEYARSFFPVLLIVLVLRSFLVEPFQIPSGSMMPTLLEGDFILVNKFSYGIRLPVSNTKLVDMDLPARGDVIVFRYPEDPSFDYIKRVVGLPGDRIRYFNKTLYINGKRADQELAGKYANACSRFTQRDAKMLVETLDGVDHSILVCPDRPNQMLEFTVPEGEYFVMGDNRDNSNDSRYWGTVPEANLVGKAFMIWMSIDHTKSGFGVDRIAWKRIGTTIE